MPHNVFVRDDGVTLQLTVSAAQDFIALLQAPKIILFR